MITTPFTSSQQEKWAFATDQPFAKDWAAKTDQASLPKKKSKRDRVKERKASRLKTKAIGDGAAAHGPGGMLGQPGLDGAVDFIMKKKKKSIYKAANYHARAGETITGNLKRSTTGQFSSGGGAGVPVKAPTGTLGQQAAASTAVARRGNNAALASSAKPGKHGRAGKKPKAIKPTREAVQSENRNKVLSALNISPDGAKALADLEAGSQPDEKAVKAGGFIESGLVERSTLDGSLRLTPKGRTLLHAADAGDQGRAGAEISVSREQVANRGARTQAAADKKAEAAAKKIAAAAAKAAKVSASAGGGGSSSKKTPTVPNSSKDIGARSPITAKPSKPSKTSPVQNRSDVLSGLGISPVGVSSLSTLAAGGQPTKAQIDHDGLIESGLVEQSPNNGSFRLTPRGQRTLRAADSGDNGAAAAELGKSKDQVVANASANQRRQERDQAAADRRAESEARRAEADARRKDIADRRAQIAARRAKQSSGG